MRNKIAAAISAVLFAPALVFAFPFGGQINQIIFCYNNAIYTNLGPPRGGPFIWTPSTRTYRFGPPMRTGQWLLGLAAPPYYCIVSKQPIIVWSGILMTMEGSSGAPAPAYQAGQGASGLGGISGINGAKGVILSICGSPDLSMHEIHEAADVIYNAVDPQANIIFGSVLDERLQGEVQVTVIATGFVPGSKSTNAERFAARKLAPKNEVDETVNAQVKMSAPKIEVSSFNPEPVFDFTPGKVSDDGSADEFDIPAFIRNRE
jgi:hypothetical protein